MLSTIYGTSQVVSPVASPVMSQVVKNKANMFIEYHSNFGIYQNKVHNVHKTQKFLHLENRSHAPCQLSQFFPEH